LDRCAFIALSFSLAIQCACNGRTLYISQYTLVLLSARAHPLIYSVDGIDFIGLYGINGATEDARRRDVRRRADQSALTIARQGETYWRLHNASRDCTRCNQRCRFYDAKDRNTRSLTRGIRYSLLLYFRAMSIEYSCIRKNKIG